jgi:uroporphyrinogen decarboxylase
MGWTKRQRIEAVFNGEQPDRVPIYDLLVNDAAIEYYSGRKLDVENGFETVCEAASNALDMTRNIFGPMKPSDIKTDRGYEVHIERWTSWITKYPFSNEEEMVRFVKDDIDILNSWKSSEKSVAEFRERCAKTQRLLKDTVNIFVASDANINYAFNVIGIENFSYLMYDEPELVSDWLRAAMNYDLRRIETFADYSLSPVAIIYCDIAYKTGLVFSREYLAKQLYPHLREVTELLHSKGIKVMFHSDGNIMSILDDLAEIGVDALNPLEIAAGMDIRAIKERYGRKFIICGGIDVTHLLPLGTKDEVVEAVKDLIRLAGNDYGLCLGSSTELEDNVPLENVKAMIETVWEYGRYPLKV